MYGNDHTFGKSYPDAWQRMAATSSGQFRSPQGLFSFTTVYPLQHVVGNGVRERMAEADKKYYWKVVAHLTPPRLQATPSNFLGRHLPLYLTMFALLAIASLLLARASVRHRHTTAQLDFERRFRKVLEGVDLLAVGLDAQGSIAFCNNALLQLAGRQRQAVIGQDWFETFVPQAQREHSKTLFHGMVSEETVPKRRESAIQTRTGEQRLISWNDTLLFDPHGQVIGVTCIGDDITEARQSEEQLRKLSRAVEQSPSTVIITGTDGTIEYVNPKFTELTGYGLDEVRGKNPRILKSGETSSAEYRYLWETITAGGEWRGVFHNKKKNGELYWEATCISPIRNAQGEITHFIAVKEDITERMRLEERFRRVVEATPNGIMMVNREGKIVLANFQTQRIFGYAREELIGQPVEMLIPERYRAAHPRYRSALFAEGKGLAMGIGQNLYGRRKDGKEVPLEI
ncbi:MAG: PAS domain S-box protein, partial [Burkholderiales bacterium]|nr:PAS domain S-box protein [Burkholderiales bacterium]